MNLPATDTRVPWSGRYRYLFSDRPVLRHRVSRH